MRERERDRQTDRQTDRDREAQHVKPGKPDSADRI